jgi:outer membrane lipoprotein LolB
MALIAMRSLTAALIISLVVSGCQSFNARSHSRSQQPPAEASDLAAAKLHALKLAQFARWRAKGKIKITVNGEPHSASFEWQQFNKNYAINFFGPLGYGNSWLRRTSKGVTFESPEQRPRWAVSAEQLMQQALGWQAPISELQYWIKGQPAPDALLDEIALIDQGAYSALTQQGWTLEFSRHLHFNDVWLPQRLEAKRDSLTVLIVIKSWERI